jgi:rare lipoprotein A
VMVSNSRTHSLIGGARLALGCATVLASAGMMCGSATAQQAGRQSPAPILYAGATTIAAPMDLRPGAAPVVDGLMAAPPAAARDAARPADSAAAEAPYAGPPYQVEGRWYVPTHEPDYNEVGVASWYGPNFHGKLASNGEVYDQYAMTAAHPTLPIPSTVRVTNLENGKSVTVRLNDRGPFIDDRIIDLSRAAAEAIDMTRKGTAKVRVEYVGPTGGQKAEPEALLAKFVPPAGAPEAMAAQPLEPMPIASQWAAANSTPAVPAAGGTSYFLQAGSFADLANAHKLKASLAPYGSVDVRSVMVGGSEYYRVMVGPWASREDAATVSDRMAAAGSKSIVIEERR